MLVVVIGGVISSCSAMLEGGLATLGSTTYPCADEDMLGAEAAYAAKEAALQAYLDNYESTHGYDAYRYDLDEIKHESFDGMILTGAPVLLISLAIIVVGGGLNFILKRRRR